LGSLISLSFAGCVAGHALTYAATLTGSASVHRYWPVAALLGAALGVRSIVVSVARSIRNRRENVSPAATVACLFIIQSSFFCAIEIVERLAAGQSLETLVANHLLAVGIAFQLAVAVAATLALRLLCRVAHAIAGSAERRVAEASNIRTWTVLEVEPLRVLALAGAAGLRGPPPAALR
jgi:hypothetical protein